MRYLAKTRGYKVYPYYMRRNGIIGFFPFDSAPPGFDILYLLVISMQEVEVQNDALETYREFLISPQHWKNFSGCAAEFINEELMKNKFTALSGTYLTLSKQNEQGYGICEIKNGRCFPEMGEYTEQSGVKFRPCAWFNLQDRQLYSFETNKLLTPEQTKIFIGK